MRRTTFRARRSLRVLVLALAVAVAPDATRADHTGAAAIYVRDDTNDTLVVSPRLRLRAGLTEDTHLELTHVVDVWTSASIDIVASASQAVTEQRDELDVGLSQVIEDLTLAGNYRYSTEPDYESHGGSASAALNLADNATTLALSLSASFDQVGRAGDPFFDEQVDTFLAGASYTQVLDPDTLVQVLYDVAAIRGYQASAYRFVALGGDGLCYGLAPFCRPEQNPRERLRHAAALRLRRALGQSWSIGAGYRFYVDDWGVVSHTARGDLAWALDPRSTLALTYRYYTQGAADHYRIRYLDADRGAAYFTRDRELSPLSSHRVALELDRVWELAGGDAGLITGLEVAPSFFLYDAFIGLDRVTALEVTAVLGMEVR